ncbi:MAG: ABC transporter ATP-binding protein [Burkholderiaceae bacterium]
MTTTSKDFRTLHIQGMERAFGGFKALDGVSLDIQRGEFVALLGPSGCGKSTALNCIAGLLAMTAGTMRLDERRIDELKPEDRGFAMVFQNYALFPHMTVRNNVGFGLRMHGVSAAEARPRIDKALALVRLSEQQDKLPAQLSGGQQQRVAIARAIVTDPSLVLMDEPLSNLDAKLRQEMRQEIRQIHLQSGATTVYDTHDQEEALSLADRVVVMREGRVQQIGTPAELFNAPVDLGVADFMGFRNRLPGRVLRRAQGRVTVELHAGPMGQGAPQLMAREPHASSAEQVVIVARPDDVRVQAPGLPGLDVTVAFTEYLGRSFQAVGETADGHAVHFVCDSALARGERVVLTVDPERALAFAA